MEKFLNLYRGRINRKYYLIMNFAVIGVVLLIDWLRNLSSAPISLTTLGIMIIIYSPLILYSISLQVRRLHDIGRTGWFTLLTFVPIISIIYAFGLFLLKGQEKANKYGPKPK